MRKIYSTTVPGQAQMLQVVLRNYGIESRLDNENAAMLAVGMATPAVPFGILVDDDRAEEAAQIVAEELRKDGPANPTAIHLQIRCACGRTLEYPKGEEPPDECPYCGRAPDGRAPQPTHAPAKPSGKRVALVLGVLIIAAAALLTFKGSGKADLPVSSSWTERLRSKIKAIPSLEVPRIDPEGIVTPILAGLGEDGARMRAAIEVAGTVEALVAAWNTLSIELSPDWAMEHGFVDSPRLSRYTADVDRKQTLLNALALQRLRKILPSPPPLDGRLFERHLERILLARHIFGTRLSDPRPATWGVLACLHVLDRPGLLAERLEQVPEVVQEIRQELVDVPVLWFEVGYADLNTAMALLREIDRHATEERLKIAVSKAREALEGFRDHLRKLQKDAKRSAPCDARWVMFLLRDLEFSGRTPRETAGRMLDNAMKASTTWASLGERPQPATSAFTFVEWRQELEKQTAAARDLTQKQRFAEVPASELPVLRTSPIASQGSPEWPYYSVRSFESVPHPTLWMRLWEKPELPQSCSPGTALITLLGETIPGRHLQTLIARRDASLIRRLFWSSSTTEGWIEYCRRWAVRVVPAHGFDLKYTEGVRYVEGWCNAVELCYLSGAMTEFEAIQFLQGGLGYTEEEAKRVIAWATLDPLGALGRSTGEEDIFRLREAVTTLEGTSFDLARFHTKLLGYGHTPVALIREELLRGSK